jgi:2-dehydro-3-deoxyphosphooctonate aldolase (KDO 8-P synthase)
MSVPRTIVAGPCVLESLEHGTEMACIVAELVGKAGFQPVFKASFDKANRTSRAAYRGPGLALGLDWLAQIKAETGLPLLTDIHEPAQAAAAAQVVDVLQIPAFLCRQTDLIEAAGRTGKAVNIKKGQFMAPPDMTHAVHKARTAGAPMVTVTERGTAFGYHNLVVDLRSVPWIQAGAQVPVWFDGTHSAQLPSAEHGMSGGDRRFVPFLCRAAVAAGCDGLFLEVHSDPARARSDSATQLSPPQLRDLLDQLRDLWPAAQRLRDAWRESPERRRLWEWTF